MMKTCSRCGIVPQNHTCPYKHYRNKDSNDKANQFRKSKAWTRKSVEIRERDKYLCQVCIRNLFNTIQTYNYNKLEVHHIVPIHEDYNLRLENDNLITLCCYHHKLADNGQISKSLLSSLISEVPPT